MDAIMMSHGSGGEQTHRLIESLFKASFREVSSPDNCHDAAYLEVPAGMRLAFTTDSFVVTPLFFPGGDIGRLAVCGTVNDLAVSGARPLWLSASFIIEEGLPLDTLTRVVQSMAHTAGEAGVQLVTGDTKVVERGQADGLYINTSGIGIVAPGISTGGHLARPGDVVIINGTIGDHGLAVMTCREELQMDTIIESDCAPLNELCLAAMDSGAVHVMRDPTRGGLATTLNEIARESRVGIVLEEAELPVHPAVQGACDLLGLDPLYAANEGKVVIIAEKERSGDVLKKLKTHPLGTGARIIGMVTDKKPGRVWMTTRAGGSRLVDMLSGDLLPRIC